MKKDTHTQILSEEDADIFKKILDDFYKEYKARKSELDKNLSEILEEYAKELDVQNVKNLKKTLENS